MKVKNCLRSIMASQCYCHMQIESWEQMKIVFMHHIIVQCTFICHNRLKIDRSLYVTIDLKMTDLLIQSTIRFSTTVTEEKQLKPVVYLLLRFRCDSIPLEAYICTAVPLIPECQPVYQYTYLSKTMQSAYLHSNLIRPHALVHSSDKPHCNDFNGNCYEWILKLSEPWNQSNYSI